MLSERISSFLTTNNQYIHGPSMVAWISVRSPSFINTLIPSGGSDCNKWSCFATTRKTCGDKFSEFDTYVKKYNS